MANYKVSELSLQYVKVPITATKLGDPADPTADTVQMAFTVSGSPQTSDWKTASWETSSDGTVYARCLIGPTGTIALTVGTYSVWVKIADAPEIPVVTPTNKLVIF